MNTSVEDRIALRLGRNIIAAEIAEQVAQNQSEIIEAAFVALTECILSGQIPDDRVQALIQSTPGFAEWRLSTKSPTSSSETG